MAPQAFLLEPQWLPMKWEAVNLKQKWMGHRQFIFPIKQQHLVMLLMSKAICGYKHVRKLRLPHNNKLNTLRETNSSKMSISLTYLSCMIPVFTTLAYFLLMYILSIHIWYIHILYVWDRIFTVSTPRWLLNLGLPLFKVMAWRHSNKLPAVYKLADVKHEQIDVDIC